MKRNHEYKIGAYISSAAASTRVTNGHGFYFTTIQPIDDPYSYGNLRAQYNNPNIISDMKNWVKIEGTFIAQGGEQRLTIGNFNNDSTSITSPANCFNGSIPGSYYYLDDVWVIPCDTTTFA